LKKQFDEEATSPQFKFGDLKMKTKAVVGLLMLLVMALLVSESNCIGPMFDRNRELKEKV